LKLCVVALRANDLAAAAQTVGLSAADVHSLAGTYGNSPDDWKPFASKSVREHVKNAGLKPVPLSAELFRRADHDAIDRLVNDVELVLIDPICVIAQTYEQSTLWRLEAAIRRARLSFCVIYPAQLPQFTRDTLRTQCEKELPLLRRAPPGQGAWDVSTEGHLTLFLDHLNAKQPVAADPSQVSLVSALLAGTAGAPAFTGAPRLRYQPR
jgi:hypothetical protein